MSKFIKLSNIVENSFIVLMSNVLKTLFYLIAFIIVFRNSDVDSFAAYGIGWSIASIGYVLSFTGSVQVLIDLKKATKSMRSAAFAQSLIISIFFSFVILLLSPYLTSIYSDIPQIKDSINLAIIFIILMTMGSLDVAVLQRTLNFKLLSIIQCISVIMSCLVSIYLVFKNMSLLALFCIQGLNGVFIFILSRAITSYKIFNKFNFLDFSSTWKVGKHVALTGITQTFSQNGFYFILALILPVKEFGFFVSCHKIVSNIIMLLNRTLDSVLLSYLSKIEDVGSVKKSFLLLQKYHLYISFLVFTYLIVCYQMVLDIFFIGKWFEDGEVLLFITLSYLIHQCGSGILTTLRSRGRPDLSWKWNIIQFSISISSLSILYIMNLSLVEYTVVVAMLSTSTIYLNYRIINQLKIDFYKGIFNIFPQMTFLIITVILGFITQSLLVSFDLNKLINLVIMGFILSFYYIILAIVFDVQIRKIFKIYFIKNA